MSHLMVGVALMLLTAAPASSQILSLTSGTAILTPDFATASAGGTGVSVQVSGDSFASSTYPKCNACPEGTRVNLSAIWLDSFEVLAVFTLRSSTIAGFDPAPTFAMVAGSVILPPLGPSKFDASVPFMTVLIEDAATVPFTMPSLAFGGGGVATASFTSDGASWQLQQVIYNFDEPTAPPRLKRKPRH